LPAREDRGEVGRGAVGPAQKSGLALGDGGRRVDRQRKDAGDEGNKSSGGSEVFHVYSERQGGGITREWEVESQKRR